MGRLTGVGSYWGDGGGAGLHCLTAVSGAQVSTSKWPKICAWGTWRSRFQMENHNDKPNLAY